MPRRRPYIRPKTIRRLLILAAIGGIATASVGIAYVAHRRADDTRIASLRETGIDAFDRGDFATALPALRATVNARPNDADALYALAAAQVSLDPQNRSALADARTRLEQLLTLAPTHLPARHKLLEIYERTGLSNELLGLSESLLKTSATDAAALRGRALALSRLDRDTEALPAWQAYIAAAPTDVRGQLQLIAAMRRAGATPDALVAHAQQLADANPGDPRYRLPLAEVLRDAGREADSLALLRSLAADPPKDETTLVELVNSLDRARAFDDGERLLVRAVDSLGSGPAITTALVERIWESGRTAQVIELTDRLLRAGRRDACVLALRAVSLAAANRRAEAKPLIDELATRKDDGAALAWTDALASDFAATPPTPAARVQALRSAVTRDPSNAIARVWLGRALIAVGEPDAAAAQYREAAQRVPSWATPCIELAETMRQIGRNAEAVAAAKAALLRSPTSPAAQVIAARVRYDAINAAADPAEETALLTFVAALRERLPDEPTLAPIHVALLARGGQIDQARSLLQATLGRASSAAMLSELYTTDRRFQLGQADAIIGRAAAAKLLTADLAYRRGLDLIADGSAPAAIALVQSQLERHANDVAWALADARVRTRAGDAGAQAAWAKLLASNGSDLRVVMAAIDDDASLAGGRAAKAELIERLNTLSGIADASAASGYRIRRAQFLASSADEQDVRQALTIASDLVRQQSARPELRVLLARILVKLDNTTTALEHLRAAHDAAPQDAAIGLEFASLLRHEGRLDEALPVLRRIAGFDATGGMADALRIQVAGELLEVGLPDVAAQMLERAERRHTLDPNGRLAYAESLRASGNLAAAASVYQTLVADDHASPAALASAAAFLRSTDHAADADRILARLSALPASTSRDHALARYHASFGEVDAARSAYAAAIASATDSSIASEAIAFELQQDAVDRAEALLAANQSKFPNDAALRRMRLELAARRESGPDTLGALASALAADPSTKAEADALTALRDAQTAGTPTPAMADAMTRLAARYPSSLDVVRLAIETDLATGRTDAAAALAYRMIADRPTLAAAQACAARTFAACGQRTAARRAAQQWRELDPSAAREADTLRASLALDDHDPARAVALLTPYRNSVDATKPADRELAITLARTLAANGQSADAFALLTPALADQSAIRAAWLSLATEPATDGGRLTTLLAATPADAVAERMQLAATCLNLASGGTDGVATIGLQAIEPVATATGATSGVRVLRGELLRVSGDLAGAERTLREALRLTPNDPNVKNSLAYVLLAMRPIDPARADEAGRLAREAAAIRPRQADVRDTIARAEWAAGRPDQAARAFREALAIDPTCLDAMVGLAALNAATGKTADASAMLPTIERRLAGGTVPLHLRRDMQSLRDALSAARD